MVWKTRLECINDYSNKFIEIEVKDNTLITRWGKIGAIPKMTIKTFASSELARNKADDYLRSKKKKGYMEAAETKPIIRRKFNFEY